MEKSRVEEIKIEDSRSRSEISAFFDSLKEEGKYFWLSKEDAIRNSEIVVGKRGGNYELIGLGGLLKRHYLKFFPVSSSYWVVKSEFQRKGVGKELLEEGCRIAKDRGKSFFLIVVHIQNAPALTLYLESRAKVFKRQKDILLLIRPLTIKGEIFYLFLKVFGKLLP